jgi:hypothetical protein
MKKRLLHIGQIALETMLNSTYKEELNLHNFEIEMRQAFKMYPRNIVLNIAEAKLSAEQKIKKLKQNNLS